MQCSLKASEKKRGPRPPVSRSREQKSDVRRFQKTSEERAKERALVYMLQVNTEGICAVDDEKGGCLKQEKEGSVL